MALPVPPSTTPRVLGIDEFALLEGHVYGTILVDMDTRRPVDLLSDRTAATVAAWLADHPGIELIRRDRSLAYAEAGRLGASGARPVADRGYLWTNLVEAAEETVVRHRALLRELPGPPSPLLPPPGGLPDTSATEPRRTGRLSDRARDQHAAGHDLLAQGVGLRPISRRLGLARNTVRRVALAASPDELLVGRWTCLPSILDPFKPFLHQRWGEGCTNAARLIDELHERGFRGSAIIVRRYVHQLRETCPHAPPRRPPSVRDVTGWLTRHPDHLTDDHKQQLAELLGRCPQLARAADHVRSFAEMTHHSRGAELDNWINRVLADDLPALHTFAVGLQQDHDAVMAGLSLDYNSGPVEGHNNRTEISAVAT